MSVLASQSFYCRGGTSALPHSGVLWVPVEVKTGEGLIETEEIMDIQANHFNGPVTFCPALSLSPDIFIHTRDTSGGGGYRWGVWLAQTCPSGALMCLELCQLVWNLCRQLMRLVLLPELNVITYWTQTMRHASSQSAEMTGKTHRKINWIVFNKQTVQNL